MKMLLQIIGIALLISGVLWALQGMGVLMWPPQSFMLAQREWALYGLITAALGLTILVLSARFGPKR